jgi:endonuclease III
MNGNPFWINEGRDSVRHKYYFAKAAVIASGYIHEIEWQSSLDLSELSETSFLKELAWVILSAGMKEQVIRGIFPKISLCFFEWKSAEMINLKHDECLIKAYPLFRNKQKISAIIESANILITLGFRELKERLLMGDFKALNMFPYIGPVTAYHLAKNLGLQVAKPDRHLSKISVALGYTDVQGLCSDVSMITGDKIPVVDTVFWRFANLEPNYIKLLSL